MTRPAQRAAARLRPIPARSDAPPLRFMPRHLGSALVLAVLSVAGATGCDASADPSDGAAPRDARPPGDGALSDDAAAPGDGATPCRDTDRFGPSTAELPAARLASGAYPDLTVCAEGEDWFAVTAEAGDGVVVALEADRAVSAALVDAAGTVVAAAEGRAPVLRATATLAALRLRVTGRTPTRYDLEVRVQAPVADCEADAHEADDVLGGVRLDAVVARALCDGDRDQAQVPGAPGTVVEVVVVVTAGEPVQAVWWQAEGGPGEAGAARHGSGSGALETAWGEAAVGRPWRARRVLSTAPTALTLLGGPAHYRVEAHGTAGAATPVPQRFAVLLPDRVPTAEGAQPDPDRALGGLVVALSTPEGLLLDAGRTGADGVVALVPHVPDSMLAELGAAGGAAVDRWPRQALGLVAGPIAAVRVAPPGAALARSTSWAALAWSAPWAAPLEWLADGEPGGASDASDATPRWRATGPGVPALHLLATAADGLAQLGTLPAEAGLPAALAPEAPFHELGLAPPPSGDLAGVTGAPAVRLVWGPGRRARCGTCFVPTRPPRIEISGAREDPDEWDDAVVLHELAHWVAAVLAHDDSPGGAHNGAPVDPVLAWSEGLADFFAAWVQGGPVLFDERAQNVRRVDLSPPPAGVADPDATPLPDLAAPHSELRVARLLWALHTGPLDDDPAALWAPVFGHLPRVAGGPLDLGVPGLDLSDYLQGLRCAGRGALALGAARAAGHAYGDAEPGRCPGDEAEAEAEKED